MRLPYPKNKEEWWNNVDKAWPELRNIIRRYLPVNNYEKINPDEHSEKLVVFSELPMIDVIHDYKDHRNPALARYFQATWMTAPDDPEIHHIPGWGVLCDLCSEEYVLYDEEKLSEPVDGLNIG